MKTSWSFLHRPPRRRLCALRTPSNWRDVSKDEAKAESLRVAEEDFNARWISLPVCSHQ